MTQPERWASLRAGLVGYVGALGLMAGAFASRGRAGDVVPFLLAHTALASLVVLPVVAVWLYVGHRLDDRKHEVL